MSAYMNSLREEGSREDLLKEIARQKEKADAAIDFITKLVHMQSGDGWTRAVVRSAAATFLKTRQIPIRYGAEDTTPAFIEAASERAMPTPEADLVPVEEVIAKELDFVAKSFNLDLANYQHLRDTARFIRNELSRAGYDVVPKELVTEENMPSPAYTQEDVNDLTADMAELVDKVEGLEADLESAVEVAFKRGAVEWTRLNYPKLYERLSAQVPEQKILDHVKEGEKP